MVAAVGVFGRTEEEHDQSLHNLMQVAAKSGLVFNSKKCIIKAPQILVYCVHQLFYGGRKQLLKEERNI